MPSAVLARQSLETAAGSGSVSGSAFCVKSEATLSSRSSTTKSCAPSGWSTSFAVSIASPAISTTTAEVFGCSDFPSCSSWSFLKPESRSFETRAPIEPPATIPIGPPMMPIVPPSSAPRPAPQSFDSARVVFPI